MKKYSKQALTLFLAFTMLICTVLAAEAAPITVQLDGNPLTFTDAAPQIKEQRTFLPFRAVFEAMGADVSYTGNIITACRGDKTLTMTIGSTEASVTAAGKTRSIQMDVAPYVDNTTWRTYVPVRFAAQAFDCAVGWDQDRSTVIIVDTERMMERAMADKHFTYMEKLSAMGAQYSKGAWDTVISFTANVNVLSAPLTVSGTVKGTIQDGDRISLEMHTKADLTKFVTLLTAMGGAAPDTETQAALKNDGILAALRGDLSGDKLYLNMDLGVLNEESGVDPGVWYAMNISDLLSGAGSNTDLTSRLKNCNGADIENLAKLLISGMKLTDSSTAYADLNKTVTTMVAALSDENFSAEGNKRSTTFTLPMDDLNMTATLSLTMDGETITDYTMNITAPDIGAEQNMTINLQLSMNAAGQMSVTAKTNFDNFLYADVDVTCQCTPSLTDPITQPPATANIVPITAAMLQA